MQMRSTSHRSGVVLASTISRWRICRTFAPCCDAQGDVDLYCSPSPRFRYDHAGHRRHVRCGLRWSAVAAVHAHYDETDFSRSSCSTARRFVPPCLASGRRQGDQALPERCCARSRSLAHTEILLRADSHYCGPEFSIGVAPCLDYILGIAPPRHCAAMSKVSKPARRRDSSPRREMQASSFHEFFDARKAGAGRADQRARRSGRELRYALSHQSNTRGARGSTSVGSGRLSPIRLVRDAVLLRRAPREAPGSRPERPTRISPT